MNAIRKNFMWLTAGVAAALLHSAATAQSPLANVDLTITHVAGNVYMIQRPGGGGNIGAQIGPDGVLLVDSLFDPMTDALLAAVREVTEEDIKYLINTHIHVDHVGGNANLAERGVVIFSHENTRQRFLEERSRFPRAGGSWVPQQPESARPQITFNDEMTFHFNGEEVLTFKVSPAHTDGDVFVYFPESDVMHLGDVYRTTSYPIIDLYNGGSLRGTIAALDQAIDLTGPNTKVIPGHGLEIMDRQGLIEFRDMILDVQAEVLSLIREDKKLEEVMAANPTAAYDSEWTDDPGWQPEDFVPIVYYQLGGSGRLADR
jgi:glyoxylase-like metal-dependent hydrolase (beta-lactamase superfamily II)